MHFGIKFNTSFLSDELSHVCRNSRLKKRYMEGVVSGKLSECSVLLKFTEALSKLTHSHTLHHIMVDVAQCIDSITSKYLTFV